MLCYVFAVVCLSLSRITHRLLTNFGEFFFGTVVCLTSNKQLDFSSGRDLDWEYFTIVGIGAIVRILLNCTRSSALAEVCFAIFECF